MMLKKVYAHFDEEGVYVYQAFKPATVKFAVENGTFGKGFGLDRITWIKPSLGWMLRRSEYASKHRMEAIAKIKLSHEAWIEILSQSIETHWNPSLFSVEDDWKQKLDKSDVIHQWDPERDLQGKRLERQAIQIGIRGEVIKKYVQEYITGVEDITALALKIGEIVKKRGSKFPEVPEEKEYPFSDELKRKLGYN